MPHKQADGIGLLHQAAKGCGSSVWENTRSSQERGRGTSGRASSSFAVPFVRVALLTQKQPGEAGYGPAGTPRGSAAWQLSGAAQRFGGSAFAGLVARLWMLLVPPQSRCEHGCQCRPRLRSPLRAAAMPSLPSYVGWCLESICPAPMAGVAGGRMGAGSYPPRVLGIVFVLLLLTCGAALAAVTQGGVKPPEGWLACVASAADRARLAEPQGRGAASAQACAVATCKWQLCRACRGEWDTHERAAGRHGSTGGQDSLPFLSTVTRSQGFSGGFLHLLGVLAVGAGAEQPGWFVQGCLCRDVCFLFWRFPIIS